MRILLVGAGGVGGAAARIAARRDFFEHMVVADYDPARAEAAVAAVESVDGIGAPGRFSAARVDASDEAAVTALLREQRCDVLFNATDPRFVMPLFRAAYAAGAHYLDMAMSLSAPHPDAPYAECGVKLGDDQFALASDWEAPIGSRSSGWASSRACPMSSPATPPTSFSTRSRRSACATGRI
jgi:saccharopine dehydrogenase (NAD+, L-lysine-forming)